METGLEQTFMAVWEHVAGVLSIKRCMGIKRYAEKVVLNKCACDREDC